MKSPIARALIAIGATVATMAVMLQLPMLAVDFDLSVRWTLAVLAAAFWLGARWAASSVLTGGAGANRVGSLSMSAFASGACWLMLANTGSPWAVMLLSFMGVATGGVAVAAAFADAIPAHSPTPQPSLSGAFAVLAAAIAAGVASAAAAFAWHPSLRWDTVTTISGCCILAGAVLRIRQPEAVDPLPAPKPSRLQGVAASVTGASVRWSAFSALGMLPTAAFALSARFQTGPRYAWIVVMLAGAAVVAVVGAFHIRHGNGADLAREQGEAAAFAAAAAGVCALAASASITLVGAVGGWTLALALAAACFVWASGVPENAVTAERARHLASMQRELYRGIAGGLLFSALASHLFTWRQVAALAALPAIVVGAKAALALLESPPTNDPSVSAAIGDKHLLEVSDLRFSYGRVQTLFGVNMHVDAHEVVALLGTNGAGKTTLLRNLAGLAHPSSGSIRFGGIDLSSFDARSRTELGLSLVSHGGSIFESLTVAENLEVFATTSRGSDARRRRAEALELFPRLAERLHQPAATLSGGEKQMLALSKVLIAQPALVIIDEFSLGLAPIVVGQLLPVVRSLHQRGAAVLIVEQSLNIALALADRAYVMEKGEIVFEGPADELRARPELLQAVYLEGITHALAHHRGDR